MKKKENKKGEKLNKKKKIINTFKLFIFLFLGMFLINLSSALYSGENQTFDCGFEIVNCSIINNTHNLNGLNLTWENTNVTISTVPNFQSDNLTISCWVIQYKEIVEHHYYSSGGSASCRYSKNFDWNCSEWGECIDGIQARTCKEKNNCGNIYGRPNTTQVCIVPITQQNDTDEPCVEEPEEPKEPKSNLRYIILGVSLALIFLTIIIWIKYKIKKRKI